ncbi:MAG: MATE family efflux transporter [Acutalibacteraceae bacterium]|nr:MATE family efflux transporter [Acutalibacteraceae bacterium]
MEAVATPLAGKPLFSNKALKKLIFPLVIEQFLAISVGFCDTVMISGLGDEAISGVSLVDMIMTLMINVFAALATGGAVVAAQFIGAKRAKDARNSASQLIFIAFIISIVLMALTLVFKAQLLRLFFSTLEEGVMQSALTYFWISALSFPFLAIYNCCAALFRAMGNSKISMLASLITTIMNIIGNAILIYGVKWGVAGAAISSTISRFAAMLLLLILLHKRDHPIYISIKDKFRPNFGLIKKILSIRNTQQHREQPVSPRAHTCRQHYNLVRNGSDSG